jgi:hypothetical protein
MASISPHLTILPEKMTVGLQTYVKIRCECGNEKFMRKHNVIKGIARTCGCKISTVRNFVIYKQRRMSLVSACKEANVLMSSVHNRAALKCWSIQEAFDWFANK